MGQVAQVHLLAASFVGQDEDQADLAAAQGRPDVGDSPVAVLHPTDFASVVADLAVVAQSDLVADKMGPYEADSLGEGIPVVVFVAEGSQEAVVLGEGSQAGDPAAPEVVLAVLAEVDNLC